ncbi:HDOD domain-containing protein, partial [bacterium]|nr:HDOD domain-containing protein [bacterium]
PESLSTAIMYHHEFASAPLADQYDLFLTATASLANKFCKKLGIGDRDSDEELDLAKSPEAVLLGYTADTVEKALETFRETFEENKSFFLND